MLNIILTFKKNGSYLFINALLYTLLIFTFTITEQDIDARTVPFSMANSIDDSFNGAHGVYTADVDSDGDIDILGAAQLDDDITWWENTNSDGSSWLEHTIDGNFNGVDALCAIDIDGDGDIDVVGAGYDGNSIGWFENTMGDGSSWTTHIVDASFGQAHHVYAADVDGDGDADIIGAAFADDDLTWWENINGDGGTWTEHILNGDFDGARAVYAADVDGDGDMDILGIASNLNDITWWENVSGDFSIYTEHPIDDNFIAAFSVYAADLDGDGDMDVLGGSATPFSEVAWWENDGIPADGGWIKHTLKTQFQYVASVNAADLDGDGDLDVLATAHDNGRVTWWENVAGNGTIWLEHNIDASFDSAASAFTADIDGDGDLDVAAAGYSVFNGNKISWWENKTIHRNAAWQHPAIDITADLNNANSVILGDLDKDGDLDIVVGFDDLTGEGEVKAYQNNGDGTYTQQDICSDLSNVYAVAIADLDKDGDLDIIAGFDSSVTGGEVKTFQNDGTPFDGIWTSQDISPDINTVRCIAVGDLDKDGLLDVVAGFEELAVNNIKAFKNDGTPFIDVWIPQDVNSSNVVFSRTISLGDLDKDGDLDMIVAGNDPDGGSPDTRIDAYANDGTPFNSVWTSQSIFVSTETNSSKVILGDLDKDGDLDIVAGFGNGITGSELKALENDGTPFVGSWTSSDIGSTLNSVMSLAIGDMDNDGDFDVVAGFDNAISGGEVKEFINDGTPFNGVWLSQDVSSNLNTALSLALADIDRDGDLDVGAGFASDVVNEVKLFKNGGGQFALPTTDTAPSLLVQGNTDDVLKVIAIHRGQLGDTDAELATMELLFEESPGVPLSTVEVNALIDNLYIYLDNGSGTFEAGLDTLVATVNTLTLNNGLQSIVFLDYSFSFLVAYGWPRTYFVVVNLTADAASQTPNHFIVTHITESSSKAEDRDNDIPLIMEYAPNVSSSVITATGVEDWIIY